MSKSTKTDILCFHCGDICRATNILHNEKHFCCDGCLTVHHILESNGLTNYYELENFPGIKRSSKADNKYDFLENTKIAIKLLEFSDENHSKFTFTLPEIHCSSCVWLLENLSKLNSGIKNVRVNFLRKEATIIFEQN